MLWQAQEGDPEIPIDPELFVASQPISTTHCDPWSILAHPVAAQRYRSRVRKIIRQLRMELKKEIRRAEKMVQEGQKLAALVKSRDHRFSPLGLYITALRAGRGDLVTQLMASAFSQHQSCPLYRSAALAWIPAEFYPVGDGDIAVVAEEHQIFDRSKIVSYN